MNLINKYNVPGPRYTSYPTVPYWENEHFSVDAWEKAAVETFKESNQTSGISLYLHLPFCESLCTYCGCNTRITVNHGVEDPYMNALLKEWNMYLELFGEAPHIKEIHLGGGTPTFFKPENLKRLLESIMEKSIVSDHPEFSFEGHPNNTTKEHMQVLFDLGFKRMSLGIQDFDPKVQDIVNRRQPFEVVKKATDIAREIGYESVNFDLIYGLPFQTSKSVSDTIDKVNELRPDRIAFYSYAHVPWVKPGQRRFTEMDLPKDEEKRALYELGKQRFIESGYVEIGMDHFALKSDALYKASETGTLHRNFMGYSASYTKLMIGLGVSSISDSWNAFAQNVKKVEEYYKLLEEDKLPVVKGHILNDEDLIIRKHILNIMCNFKTNWQNEDYRSPALLEGLERLHEIEADGLLTLSPYALKVTEAGRPFIRNICMALDARLWRHQPETQIFSQTI